MDSLGHWRRRMRRRGSWPCPRRSADRRSGSSARDRGCTAHRCRSRTPCRTFGTPSSVRWRCSTWPRRPASRGSTRRGGRSAAARCRTPDRWPARPPRPGRPWACRRTCSAPVGRYSQRVSACTRHLRRQIAKRAPGGYPSRTRSPPQRTAASPPPRSASAAAFRLRSRFPPKTDAAHSPWRIRWRRLAVRARTRRIRRKDPPMRHPSPRTQRAHPTPHTPACTRDRLRAHSRLRTSTAPAHAAAAPSPRRARP